MSGTTTCTVITWATAADSRIESLFIIFGFKFFGSGLSSVQYKVDSISIETCVPADFCSNGIVTTSNITSNTVNLNWSGDASDWEYILQLKDGSVPTASDSGVVVNTTSDNAIGLNSFTDYEVYYRAICNSNAKSNWGLTSFKTEISLTNLFFEKLLSTISI